MKILVVEDDAKVSRALQQGLTAEGYEVSSAGTGEEAFFVASEQRFALAVAGSNVVPTTFLVPSSMPHTT